MKPNPSITQQDGKGRKYRLSSIEIIRKSNGFPSDIEKRVIKYIDEPEDNHGHTILFNNVKAIAKLCTLCHEKIKSSEKICKECVI